MVAAISPSKRAYIVHLKQKGLSDRDVANRLAPIGYRTVGRIWSSYLRGDDIFTPGHSTGRPRKMDESAGRWAALLISRGVVKTAAELHVRKNPRGKFAPVRQIGSVTSCDQPGLCNTAKFT